MTDHYGRIGNFDCLVGVLLSDVEGPMSGELCCYPGSHRALAAHFRGTNPTAAPDGSSGCPELERVRHQGSRALPTGLQTDALFGSEPPQWYVGSCPRLILITADYHRPGAVIT